jgi:hypothetical protein
MAAGPNEDSPLRAMGRHYLNPRLAGDTRVEARRPVLVYERRGGRLRLTGVEYRAGRVPGPSPRVTEPLDVRQQTAPPGAGAPVFVQRAEPPA